MELIDLHVHSNASDGTLSPAAVVALAAPRGLPSRLFPASSSPATTREKRSMFWDCMLIRRIPHFFGKPTAFSYCARSATTR